MTLTNTKRTKRGQGNDVTTIWPYDFVIPDETNVIVQVYNSTTLITVTISSGNYSISGIGTPTYGNVTYPLSGSPLTSDEWLIITREVPLSQETEISNQGGFYPKVLEDQLDLIVMQTQQLNEQLSRAVVGLEGDTFEALPKKTELADVTLAFNSSGDPIPGPTSNEIINAQGYATAAAISAASAALDAAATSIDVASTTANVGYAQEWAINPEDVLISAAAGGNQTDDYSALHHAAKAAALVASIGAVVIIIGNWDASVGTFPGSGVAQTGWSYVVSVAGTVDGVGFSVNDRIIALADNASTGTYIGNWLKADYSDQVPSSRLVTAGTGLTGGGDLSADRTFNVDVGTTANKILQLNGSAELPAVSGANLTNLPGPVEYASLPQSWVNNTVFTIAHTLGQTPFEFWVEFIATSTSYGYAVGDPIPVVQNYSYSLLGLTLTADASNVYVMMMGGNGIIASRKNTPSYFYITPAHFDIRIKARKAT